MEGKDEFWVIEKTLYYCADTHWTNDLWTDPHSTNIFNSKNGAERMAKVVNGKLRRLLTREDFKQFKLEYPYDQNDGAESSSNETRSIPDERKGND